MLPLLIGGETQTPLTVLCLGAHSDDIEIGCGGTILTLLSGRRPISVHWHVFSAAGPREREAISGAQSFLQHAASKSVTPHAFRDGYFPAERAAIKDVFEDLKAAVKPDLIFTHTGGDAHQDHRLIHELTWNTFRNHLILEYEIPKYDADLTPANGYMPLTKAAAARKVKLLMRVFATQRGKHWFCEEVFLGLMRLRGLECAAPGGYAEGFHIRKCVLG